MGDVGRSPSRDTAVLSLVPGEELVCVRKKGKKEKKEEEKWPPMLSGDSWKTRYRGHYKTVSLFKPSDFGEWAYDVQGYGWDGVWACGVKMAEATNG